MVSSESTFPRVPQDLLEALEDRFQDRCPPRGSTEADVAELNGNLAVVRFLRAMFDYQNNSQDE